MSGLEAIIHWFSEPLTHAVIQRALMTAMIMGATCAILSCYLVLKGWSLMGDAISHAVLPGIVVAYIFSIPFAIGAFISGLICALATGFIKENSRIKEDSVMGIVFSGMFALGMLMYVKAKPDQHLDHIILGNLLGVRNQDLWQLCAISAFISLIFALKWKDFLLFCFDASHARVAGLNIQLMHYGLLSLLALAIVASLQAVGVVMVIAMLIAPGITAFIITKRFAHMIGFAVAISILSCVLGTLASYHIGAATSACIILCQSSIFCIVLVGQSVLTLFQEKVTAI